MKKFIIYLLVIIVAVSTGFAVFYLVRDNEIISISSASIYKDAGDTFVIDVNHENKKSYTEITISSSNDAIVKYDKAKNNFTAVTGGVARINFRTTNSNFRNLWCDVIVGNGTKESPFYISTIDQLSAIGRGAEILDVNDNGTGIYAGKAPYTAYSSDKCYKLVNNIDASQINQGFWIPLKKFSGRFDGNGLTISNINIDRQAYMNNFSADPNYDPTVFGDTNVGLFEEITETGMVYNLKLVNYTAKGLYQNFGTIAAINKGVIERVEVKDAFLGVQSELFGGLVASNQTTEEGSSTSYTRNIARIDRCSINMVTGKTNVIENGESVSKVLGITGKIGGLVGENLGGTLIYSYVKGEMYFGDDSTNFINYGGLISDNKCITLTSTGGAYTNVAQGASIKDCYSDIKTFLLGAKNVNSNFAGAINVNEDKSVGNYDGNADQLEVCNNIIGVYYNLDSLNHEQTGIVKGFTGLNLFKYDAKTLAFAEQETIIKGLNTAGMQDKAKYVSHNTHEIQFDSNGTSLGIVKETPVSWLFDTVWAHENEVNDNEPYLNYQLVYIPDDFRSAGVPIIENDLIYRYTHTIDFPPLIVSGSDGKINLNVGDTYDLVVSPVGQSYTWHTSDNTVVSVDANGKITANQIGSAVVTVKSTTGSTSSIIVIVNGSSYVISNYPNDITLTVGKAYIFNTVTVTPATTLTYTSSDTSVFTTSGNTVMAVAKGTATLLISAGSTSVAVNVTCLDNTPGTPGTPTGPVVAAITLNPATINEEYDGTNISGNLNVIIEDDTLHTNITASEFGNINVTSSNPNILTIDSVSNNKIYYTIKGVGNVYITVRLDSASYKGGNAVYAIITPKNNPQTPVINTLALNYSSRLLNTGDTLQLIATQTGTSTLPVTYVSLNQSVATVGSTGLVTAVGAGTTQIQAYIVCNNNTYVYAYCSITVQNIVARILTINPGNITAVSGDKVKVVVSSNIPGDTFDWHVVIDNACATETIINNSTREYTINNVNGIVDITVTAVGSKDSTLMTIQTQKKNAYSKYIYNRAQLEAINDPANLGRDYYLAADINLSSANWTPIGTESAPFTGKIQALTNAMGKTFKISNMKVDNVDYAGLFGYTRNANIDGISIANANVNGKYSGVVVGKAVSTHIRNCSVASSSVSAKELAGGIVGFTTQGTSITGCSVDGSTSIQIITGGYNGGEKQAGGITGYTDSASSISNCNVNISGSISAASGVKGYIGGIVGENNGSIDNCRVSATITTNNTNYDCAGGIAGYNTGNINKCIISNSTIKGYYAGGIGGIDAVRSGVTIKFSSYSDGYRRADITSSNYSTSVGQVAVKESVTIKGIEVGGLFGVIRSGVVSNCYTRARLEGTSAKAVKGGFASEITSNGFKNYGGTGTAGVVEYCYSACTFAGSGSNFSVTQSLIHNSVGLGEGSARSAGYIFNYVFDDNLDGNAKFVNGSNLFEKDKIQSKKSSSDMQKSATYTAKSFNATYWNLNDGYPTLKFEK